MRPSTRVAGLSSGAVTVVFSGLADNQRVKESEWREDLIFTGETEATGEFHEMDAL